MLLYVLLRLLIDVLDVYCFAYQTYLDLQQGGIFIIVKGTTVCFLTSIVLACLSVNTITQNVMNEFHEILRTGEKQLVRFLGVSSLAPSPVFSFSLCVFLSTECSHTVIHLFRLNTDHPRWGMHSLGAF